MGLNKVICILHVVTFEIFIMSVNESKLFRLTKFFQILNLMTYNFDKTSQM